MMNCDETRQTMLDSLVETIPDEPRKQMESHLATCSACRQFAQGQQRLDARLADAAPAASLSAEFRASLRARIHHDSARLWSDSLPDIAHLAGCTFVLILSVLLLPFSPVKVIFIGAIFTGTTYLLQGALRSSMDRFEQ